MLGRAETQEEFTEQLKALRDRAGGDVLWPVERLAHLSLDKPWPTFGSVPREDLVRIERWFVIGPFPYEWASLERVLRGLHATPVEVGLFASSFRRIVKAAPVRVPDVATALVVVAVLTVIGLSAAAVLQSGSESWIAKTLTALGALVASVIIWGVGVALTVPNPGRHSPYADWSPTLVMFGSPPALAAAVIIPFATGTDRWGRWFADLIGLL
ncbi:hypothetical protein [Streptomyces sp. NPDC058622]|uniref:hypothetical protein n=1 Tax=Streptomyces sp. NPDC058622 TaxID=3346562 RepID=UPI0036642769